jgi:hypothetical protein
LHFNSIKYYVFVVCVCSFSYPACTAHSPSFIVVSVICDSTIIFQIILSTILKVKYVTWTVHMQFLSLFNNIIYRNERCWAKQSFHPIKKSNSLSEVVQTVSSSFKLNTKWNVREILNGIWEILISTVFMDNLNFQNV